MVSLVGGGFCILGIHLVTKCEVLSSTRLDNEGFVQLEPRSLKLVQVHLTKQFFLDSTFPSLL